MSLLATVRGNGRDPSRATLMARGVALLCAIVLAVTLLVLVGRGAFADEVPVRVRLDDAGGSLVPGTDVKYDGVVVGRVGQMRRVGQRVEVAATLDPDLSERLPADVRARVLPATIFGTSFIDLVGGTPVGPGTDTIRADQVIAQDLSRPTLEIQAVLDQVDGLVKALGPARLSTTLDNMATALRGNGEALGQTMVRLDRLLAKINPEMPRIRRNLRLLATNLEAFREYAPGLLAASDNALVAARTIAERETDFRRLARRGARSMDSTNRLLVENRRALAALLVRLSVVVDVLYDGRGDLIDALSATSRLGTRFADAMSYGPYVRVDAELRRNAGPQYTPRDCPQYGAQRGRGC